MADVYTVGPGESLQSIASKQGVSLQQMKQQNPELASRNPPYSVQAGDTIKVPPRQQAGNLLGVCETCECIVHDLAKPFLIAVAKDGNIVKQVTIQTEDGPLDLGQDATHETGSPVPDNQVEVASDEASLKAAMNDLLVVFARDDTNGKAKKIFDSFQSKKSDVTIFMDAGLNQSIAASSNFQAFSSRTLAAPGTEGASPDKTRIHQGLKKVGWDINKVTRIEDLGVPAFNSGTKTFDPILNSEDWSNGLAVMINGVQYVFVYVTKYHYDSCPKQYRIELRFVLYDVFGLDDPDVKSYGVTNLFNNMASRGITAWWQLQHQHDYAPLLLRAVVTRHWTVSTAGQ
jgi:LysM repeat protein